MEVKITEKNENPLTEREEIKFEIEHKNAPTPSRAEVVEELSSELEVPEKLIVVEKIATPHGRYIASGKGRIYESEERLEELEPKHLTRRTETSKEKETEKEEAEEEGSKDSKEPSEE